MSNSMIIQKDDGSRIHNIRIHYICEKCTVNYLHGASINNQTIPIFYSEKEAFENGWRKTTHHKFSKNGRPVWVCPKCWPGD